MPKHTLRAIRYDPNYWKASPLNILLLVIEELNAESFNSLGHL